MNARARIIAPALPGASFRAKYEGRCRPCGTAFGPDDYIRIDSGVVVGVECCNGTPDVVDVEELMIDDEDDPATPQVRIKKVMPRGRTVADRCNRCFQIPASNGVCGC